MYEPSHPRWMRKVRDGHPVRDPLRAAGNTTESTTERDTNTKRSPRASAADTNPTMSLLLSPSRSFPLVFRRASLFSPIAAFTHQYSFVAQSARSDSLFSLSPFHSRTVAAVCSPGIAPSPSVTTYISFRGLTGAGRAASLSWSLSLRAITLFPTKLLRRLQRYRGSKIDVDRIWNPTDTNHQIINKGKVTYKCKDCNCKAYLFKKKNGKIQVRIFHDI